MAYNNGFPMGYPQYYVPQPQAQSVPVPQVSQPQNSPMNTGIIWVQGEAGAKSYLVAPNNTVQLWDSESQTIYLKSADASGMPSMRILDYTIRDMNPPQIKMQTEDYATKADMDGLRAEIERLKEEMNNMSSRGKSDEKSNLRAVQRNSKQRD